MAGDLEFDVESVAIGETSCCESLFSATGLLSDVIELEGALTLETVPLFVFPSLGPFSDPGLVVESVLNSITRGGLSAGVSLVESVPLSAVSSGKAALSAEF